ncbi:MAG TPA: hypothetical protein VFZ53_00485, partial [Polyangiaceae bacterium]
YVRDVERGLCATTVALAGFAYALVAGAQEPAAPPAAPPSVATPDGPAPAPAPPPESAPATPTPAPAPAPTPPGTTAPPATSATELRPAPPATTGFQMAFRFGLAFPFGDATGAPLDTLGARYAWQVPLGLDIGGKLGPNVFVGGYLTYAFGAEGSDTLVEALCDDDDEDLENDVSCGASSLRFGLQVQYHFTPAEKTNGWIGFGAGLTSASQYLKDNQFGYSETVRLSGYTVAQLSGGLDLRSKLVGAGPYAELSLGRFTRSSTEVDARETASGDIDDPAWHAWLTFGIRMVLFP